MPYVKENKMQREEWHMLEEEEKNETRKQENRKYLQAEKKKADGVAQRNGLGNLNSS